MTRAKYGQIKAAVAEAHAKHPDWTAPRIANAIGSTAATVRATAGRLAIALPSANNAANQTPEQRAKGIEAISRARVCQQAKRAAR